MFKENEAHVKINTCRKDMFNIVCTASCKLLGEGLYFILRDYTEITLLGVASSCTCVNFQMLLFQCFWILGTRNSDYLLVLVFMSFTTEGS